MQTLQTIEISSAKKQQQQCIRQPPLNTNIGNNIGESRGKEGQCSSDERKINAHEASITWSKSKRLGRLHVRDRDKNSKSQTVMRWTLPAFTSQRSSKIKSPLLHILHISHLRTCSMRTIKARGKNKNCQSSSQNVGTADRRFDFHCYYSWTCHCITPKRGVGNEMNLLSNRDR